MAIIDEAMEVTAKIKYKNLKIGYAHKLTLSDIKNFCAQPITLTLDENTIEKMKASQIFLESYINKRIPIYGVNTQFGDQVCFLDNSMNADAAIYYRSISDRQENLIKSHVCGMGQPVSPEVVKVAMLLRAHCLSQGYSGVSIEVVETMLAWLNAGMLPVVPKYGSIGASGDLIPLATIAAALIGEDVEVYYKNRTLLAKEALELAGIQKLNVKMRDGLAMINGTSFMTAIASVTLCDLQRLFKQLLVCIAMALESLMAISSAYHPLVHRLKGQKGQFEISHFFLEFWKGSQLLMELSSLEDKISREGVSSTKTIQDYYSLRAVAQGFGPFQENLENAITWVENEMNSVNDNPIIDISGKQLINNANFMGYYITDACDILKMNIAQASTWLHALLANLVHPRKSYHLPASLVDDPSIHNGFRPLQLLAASLAVQNRKLAQVEQAYSLPTEGDNQDVNSLGVHAALDFQEAVLNLERLTAILLLASVQALEFRGIEKASRRAQSIYHLVRKYSPTLKKCRPMHGELNKTVEFLRQEVIN